MCDHSVGIARYLCSCSALWSLCRLLYELVLLD